MQEEIKKKIKECCGSAKEKNDVSVSSRTICGGSRVLLLRASSQDEVILVAFQ